jgi:DNA-binding SARP family transcriptional activator
VEFRILGPLEVLRSGRPMRFGGPRERALLAILLIHAGEVVSADRLIDGLWGGTPPANPANALQVVVSRVRRALADEHLVTRRPGYLLAVDPDEDELDTRTFGRLVQEAQQTAPEHASRRSTLLAQALGLWCGPALADFAFEDFARPEVARLEEARMRAVEMRTDAQLALGRHAELVQELAALVAGHGLRERLRCQLMLALYRSGRQGEALRVFQQGRRLLAEELGVDPGPELRDLHQRILLQAPDLDAAPPAGPDGAAPRDNLPAPVTSFVGRDAELLEAKRLLAGSRLLTLTGPGGSGKTRLALETAGALLESFPDGVRLVRLEALSDPAEVPRSLAAGVGLGEGGSLGVSGESPRPLVDRLVDYLRGKELLIVVDNCEHLIEPCARVVGRVLRSAPGVRFLATSRERLAVDGEALLSVPPLGLPSAGERSLERLGRSEAVRLFVERAAAVRTAFVLDDESGPAVGRICRRLDGTPLALELAAAQVRILSPAQIAARLDDRLGLPGPGGRGALPRHRTLQAAVEWSYGLLTGPERELFARLSSHRRSGLPPGEPAPGSRPPGRVRPRAGARRPRVCGSRETAT